MPAPLGEGAFRALAGPMCHGAVPSALSRCRRVAPRVCSGVATLWHALLVVAALVVATSLHGCLPPDWSFCDCDFRDNFWNTVISDVHRVFDGPDWTRKARDNTTFQGKYLQSMPEGFECPMIVDSFWKGWPRFGLTRALIEGSLGDLWMPAARDRFKQICMAGHVGLIAICAQHWLVRAAHMIEDGQPDHMKYLEAAYSHMVALRNLGGEFRLVQCMGQQGWPMRLDQLRVWAEKWIGKESQGVTPIAAYAGGQLDPYQMLFDKPMHHTERTRVDALPERRPCVPYKHPQCWKRMSKLLIETCEHCCSPFIHKSGRGDPTCFDSVWTYERCCQADFQDLICEMKRKGEEGGCVDCKKTVSWVCLTPPEKNLQDAQNKYNEKVDKYNQLQTDSQRLAKEVSEARLDLDDKTERYRWNYSDFDVKLRIWSVAYNNETRLLSASRLQQQMLTWNASARALSAAQTALRLSQDALRNAMGSLRQANDEKARGEGLVKSNESAYEAASSALNASREHLELAREARRAAERDALAAAAAASAAAMSEQQRRAEAVAENQSLEEVIATTAERFDASLGSLHVTEKAESEAQEADRRAEAAAEEARRSNSTAHDAVAASAAAVVKAVQGEEEAVRALESAESAATAVAERLRQSEEDRRRIAEIEAHVHGDLLNVSASEAAVRCLIERTPANMSARPSAVRTCDAHPGLEDLNEFCKTWAQEGKCERNKAFMQKTCPRSCAKGVAETSACTAPATGVDMTRIVAELLSNASALLARGFSSLADIDVSLVPETFRDELTASIQVLANMQRRHQEAGTNLTVSQKLVVSSEEALQKAEADEARAVGFRDEAKEVAKALEIKKRVWDAMLSRNESEVSKAADLLSNRKDDRRRLEAAIEKAKALEAALDRASGIADEEVSAKRKEVSRLRWRVQMLGEQIRTLNESLSENLTTAVTAWLEAKDTGPAAAPEGAGGWGERLLRVAKSALISMVSSIERVLEQYVVSLTDARSVHELVRAVDDRKAAALQLTGAERDAVHAEAQATDARGSFQKAEVARRHSEAAALRGAELVEQAEVALAAVEEVLRRCQAGHAAAAKELEVAKEALAQREAELQEASEARLAASEALRRSGEALVAAKAALAGAAASVSEAEVAVQAANGALAAAAVGAESMYMAELRASCAAGEHDFEAYFRRRELLSLVHAFVNHQAREHADAEEQHRAALAARGAAEAARAAAAEALLDARIALGERAEEAEAAAVDLAERLAHRNITWSRLLDAREVLAQMRDSFEAVRALRVEASDAAAEAAAQWARARHEADAALARSLQRSADVGEAVNKTQVCLQAMLAAEAAKAKAKASLEDSRVWFEEFEHSLLLPVKRQVVADAESDEKQRIELEAGARRREALMRRLLATHERHLALCNAQVDLAVKEVTRASAKAIFEDSEKAVVGAQKKLETLTEEEAKCNKDIQTTYADLQTLLKEHAAATEAYDKQDPKERERSFSTKLEGAGADPG